MTTLIRKTGLVGLSPVSRPFGGSRAILTASDGSAISVVADVNSTQAAGGFGAQNNLHRIYVYSSPDRVNWTLRTTITPAVGFALPVQWTAELYSDDSVGVAYRGSDGTVRYHKVDRVTWAAGPSSTAMPVTNGVSPVDFDLHISESDVPFVAVNRQYASGANRSIFTVYTLRTSDSTWVLSQSVPIVGASTPDPMNRAVSVSVLKGGTSASRRIVLAGSGGNYNGADLGVKVYSCVVNESTGIASEFTFRKTIAAGDIQVKHGLQGPVRAVKLFTNAADQVTLGVFSCHSGSGAARVYAARFSWDGANWGEIISPSFASLGGSRFNPVLGLAITYGSGGLAFFGSRDSMPSDKRYDIEAFYAKITPQNTVRWSGAYKWNDMLPSGFHHAHLFGNGQRNFEFNTHDTGFFVTIGLDEYYFYHQNLKSVKAPVIKQPANGSTIITSVPTVTVSADVDTKYSQASYKVVWQFALDSAFTSGVREYIQSDSKYVKIDGTQVAGVVVNISDVLPQAYSLPQGNWYVRSALINSLDVQGAWSPASSFSTMHPPAAYGLAPSNGQYLGYSAAGVKFSWSFSDPSSDDYQTAFEILVIDTSTSATVLSTGKIDSSTKSYTGVIPAAVKDTPLAWMVKLWDRDDVAGSYSPASPFFVGDPATIAISLPGGNVSASPTPAFELTGDSNPGRVIKFYKFSVENNGQLIYSSLLKSAGDLSGAYSIVDSIPAGTLTNSETYKIKAYVVDSANIQSAEVSVIFDTLWEPPVTPTGVIASALEYNTEDKGYVSLFWDDTGRDADFLNWNIYRKTDEVDFQNNVLEEGPWVLIGTSTEVDAVYEYRDYYAPSNARVNYRITQSADRFGDNVESDSSATVSVFTLSEGYWLVGKYLDTLEVRALMLPTVVSDSYSDEYEESEFSIAGRGRFIERGDHLGIRGTLDVHIRDTRSKTARQYKKDLENLKEQNTVLSLRTPFGDIYRISAGNLSISRIAGVGKSEFVDVSIPYAEVGE